MSKAPAFQLYASDFYMDTVDWTATEIGIYFRLLMSEWVNGALENDTERLARIAGIDHGNFKKLWCRSVGGKFTPNGNGKLVNRRLEEVRNKQEEFYESQSKSGLKGIEVKKSKGIFPFNKSTDPSSNPSTDPARVNQALHSSSSKDIYNNSNVEISKNVEIPPKKGNPTLNNSQIDNNINCGKPVEIPKTSLNNTNLPKKWYKNERGNYVCSTCQKSFMAYQKLQDHIAIHRGP